MQEVTGDDLEAKQSIDYTSIIKPTLQYELYNPSPKSMEFSHAGVDFFLPSRDKRWRGKDPGTGQTVTYPEPGVMPVWGIPEQKITALHVVTAAVGKDGLSGYVGINGVRPLFGDSRDVDVRKEAQEAWLRKQLSDWTTTTRNHERSVAKAKEDGEPPPNPPRLVREAYEGLAKYGAEAEEFLQVRCGTCNWGFSDEPAMWRHVLGAHKDRKAEAEAALALDGSTAKVVTGKKAYEEPEDKGKLPTAQEVEDALNAVDDEKPKKK